MGLQPGCWVQLHVGQVDVSMENCSMKTGAFCPKCGQKGFFFLLFFFKLEQVVLGTGSLAKEFFSYYDATVKLSEGI